MVQRPCGEKKHVCPKAQEEEASGKRKTGEARQGQEDGFILSAGGEEHRLQMLWEQMLGRGWEATGRCQPSLLPSLLRPSATFLPPPHPSAPTCSWRGQTGSSRSDLITACHSAAMMCTANHFQPPRWQAWEEGPEYKHSPQPAAIPPPAQLPPSLSFPRCPPPRAMMSFPKAAKF